MNTPIYDFLTAYSERKGVRFHMPGHKGKSFLGIEHLDITEIAGADVLGEAEGIIGESERCAASLFGTAKTLYSTEGSTLCIKTMLSLVSRSESTERPLVLAARNVHKAFVYAAAILDIDVEWIYPETASNLCSCKVTPEGVRRAIDTAKRKPCALYLTSPDYLGSIADIQGISAVCREKQIPLLVDNAHGAYLNFLKPSLHPIALGADLCCDSAHKTLPVLTGGAYLHISKNAPSELAVNAKTAMMTFASTSPSYLCMASLDLCNRYISEDYTERLERTVATVENTKKELSRLGLAIEASEPLKIVVNATSVGYTGEQLCNIFRENNIEPEFCDEQFVVLMATCENSDSDFLALVETVKKVEKREPLALTYPTLPRAEAVVSIRRAVFSKQKKIDVSHADGKICASPTVSCPPAIPIAVSGERITEETVAAFKHYGIEKISVIE